MNSKISTLITVILLYLTQIAFAQDYNKTHTYKNNNGVTNTQLEYRGKIVFTEDETDVQSISPGGFLRFSKRSFGTKRTMILEGESNNNIYREYREGSKKVAFTPDGKRWMASVLPEIIRTTGIGASERVKRFYAQGGINALTKEIGLISSNYVQGIYYDAAFQIPALKPTEMAVLIESAGEQVSGSYELSRVLRRNIISYKNEPSAVNTAIIAASNISSPYEKSRVYKQLLNEASLSEAQIGEIIKNAGQISSSYDKSNVLQKVMAKDLSAQNIKLLLIEAGSINSSYEQSKVLQTLLKNQQVQNLDFNALLNAINKIGTSYEKSSVLRLLVTTKKLSGAQIKVLAQASTSIGSSYEQSMFLKSLVNEQTLDESSINSILVVVNDIGSSYEQSAILQLVIAHPSFTKTNFSEAIKQTTRVSSSYEQSKILSQIIGLQSMPATYFMQLIEAISKVSSSYERAKLLKQLAPQIPEQKEVKDAFFKAAESLSNDDYGKVMRAMRQ